jgi:hypothetical protein
MQFLEQGTMKRLRKNIGQLLVSWESNDKKTLEKRSHLD